LNTLKRVARLTDLNIDGSHLNLDGGFDSRHNRKAIFNAGLIPNIKENPRNRKTPKRGRKRLFDAASIRYGSAWSGPLPGRTNSNGFCCALSSNNSATTA
jgi:hypothetical protein